MMMYLSIAAFAVVAVLGWNLYRRLGNDRIAQFNDKRRATSRMVSPGQFVDGNRHLPVALAVTQSMFFYENSDMQASLDLQWVREIEYDPWPPYKRLTPHRSPPSPVWAYSSARRL